MANEKTVRIDGLLVDIDALSRLSHSCDPALCADRVPCCAHYEISLEPGEVETLAGMLPLASRYAFVEGGDGEEGNVFDEEDGEVVLDTTEEGECLLMYRDTGGRPLCSLHTAAAEAGLYPYRMKPRSCTLWPLALSEGEDPVLGVQDETGGFPCNRARRGVGLDAGVAEILEALFGTSFLEKVEEALGEGGGGGKR